VSDELRIDCKWLGRQTGSPIDRGFYADIGLAVGEDWLTVLEDLEASTVRHHLRGCVHRLAMWFAANWWRLRWEPALRSTRKDVDWRIAHSVGSAGGGYVWPNVLFASDGECLTIASIPRPRGADFEPIRYLKNLLVRITAGEFERRVDGFMEGVLSRLHSLGIEGDQLPVLWAEVVAERQDSHAARWRKLEALCGYDPDEAPDQTIETLMADQAALGSRAIEEVAAHGRHEIATVLSPICTLATSNATPAVGGFRGKMPFLSGKQEFAADTRPWQRADQLAREARKDWGLAKEPVTNRKLADLLGTDEAVFTDPAKGPTTIPIVLREETKGCIDLYFSSSWSTSRRFATGRLLGDYLYYANGDRLIPATEARTARQQFQRAFAQEFLCPFDALQEKIQTDQPDEEDIVEAADHFGVSPLLVRTTLVNKGELDRDVLAWAG
jgi:hypothetical protein